MKCKICDLVSDNEEEFVTKFRCVTCHKLKTTSYRQKYYVKNKKKFYNATTKWRKANMEHWLAYKRDWEKNNPDKVKEYRKKSS